MELFSESWGSQQLSGKKAMGGRLTPSGSFMSVRSSVVMQSPPSSLQAPTMSTDSCPLSFIKISHIPSAVSLVLFKFLLFITHTGALFLLFSYSGVSDSLWPHGLQPTKLLCQWDTQVRILEWGAVSSSRGSSWLMDQTRIFCISCIAGGFFTTEPPGKQLVLYQC